MEAMLEHNTVVRGLYYDTLSGNVPYLVKVRNFLLIPAAVHRTTLFLIGISRTQPPEGRGLLIYTAKEIVKAIALQVYASRYDPIWIRTVPAEQKRADQKQARIGREKERIALLQAQRRAREEQQTNSEAAEREREISKKENKCVLQ